MSWEAKNSDPDTGINLVIGHCMSKFIGFETTEEFMKAVKARDSVIFDLLEGVVDNYNPLFRAHELSDLGIDYHLNGVKAGYLDLAEFRQELEAILVCELVSDKLKAMAQRGLDELDAWIEYQLSKEAKKLITKRRRSEFDRKRNSLMLALIRRDGYQCAECGTTEDLTVDHKIPISKGGTDDLENLGILCRYHNSLKCDQIAEERTPENVIR